MAQFLHVGTYKAGDEAAVVEAINRAGYGLTFGMHSRIDANIDAVSKAIHVGNVYINRNQIGAVVGSQPFGGHRLSGTGPKAGGRLYLTAFLQKAVWDLRQDPRSVNLPGPSGERNSYQLTARKGKVLVLHEDDKVRQKLASIAVGFGNAVTMFATFPETLEDVDVVMTQIDNSFDGAAVRKNTV